MHAFLTTNLTYPRRAERWSAWFGGCLYWYHRLKLKVIHATCSEDRSVRAEDEMIKLAKHYDW